MFVWVEPGNCQDERFSNIDIEVFSFDRPVIQKRNLKAAANGPSVHVLRADQNGADLDPAKCSAAGQIGKEPIVCIAYAAPDRSQPWPLFCARCRIASGSILSLRPRPRIITLNPEHECSGLPVYSGGEATDGAGDIVACR